MQHKSELFDCAYGRFKYCCNLWMQPVEACVFLLQMLSAIHVPMSYDNDFLVHTAAPALTVGRMVRYYFGRMNKFAKGSKSVFVVKMEVLGSENKSSKRCTPLFRQQIYSKIIASGKPRHTGRGCTKCFECHFQHVWYHQGKRSVANFW